MEDEPTKQEELQTDLNDDIIRDTANEINDGAMDVWIAEHIEELNGGFITHYNDEWIDYCKERWKEENE